MAKGKTASEEKASEKSESKRTVLVREKEEKEKPVWLKFTDKDVEAIVLKLAKQGLTSEKIGLELRDSYGIPKAKLVGKKIGQILKEHNLDKNAALLNLEKRQQVLKKHLEKHKQDKKSKRSLSLISARISKIQKYAKRKL